MRDFGLVETWGATRYGDPCRECGYRWSITPERAIELVAGIPDRFESLVDGHDAGARHPDAAWSAGAYVCHVTDNLRIWAERLAGAVLGGVTEVAGYDENQLAVARDYARVPVAGALWSLRDAAARWTGMARRALDADVVLTHAERGTQRATDVARNNAHDAHHHEWDIRRAIGHAAPTEVIDAIDTVAWVCLDNGKILGARSRGKDTFYLPGGKREPGETDVRTLVREIAEELAVTIDPATATHLGVWRAAAHAQADGVIVRMACYTAAHHGDPAPSAEIEELAWLGYADRDRVAPVDQVVFDHLRAAGQLS